MRVKLNPERLFKAAAAQYLFQGVGGRERDAEHVARKYGGDGTLPASAGPNMQIQDQDHAEKALGPIR